MADPIPNNGGQRPLTIHIHRGNNRHLDSMACFAAREEGGLHVMSCFKIKHNSMMVMDLTHSKIVTNNFMMAKIGGPFMVMLKRPCPPLHLIPHVSCWQ